MDWKTRYKDRVLSAQEAVQVIESHNRLFLTGNVSVPYKLLDALVKKAPDLEDVEICQALTVGAPAYVSPEMEGHLRVNTMFISDNIRQYSFCRAKRAVGFYACSAFRIPLALQKWIPSAGCGDDSRFAPG